MLASGAPGAFIPVLYSGTGVVAYMARYHEIRRQERAGVLRTVGTRKRVYAAVLMDGPPRPKCGQVYSHNHETKDNPKGVWTFTKGAS
jgi:hypothetical protein